MRMVARIAGLLSTTILLVAVALNVTNSTAPRAEDLTLPAYAFEPAPADDLPITLSDIRLPPLPALTAPLPQQAPITLTVPANDLADEWRAWRAERAKMVLPVKTATPVENFDLFVRLPPDAANRQPLRVLLVLHGMGGKGEKFAQALISESDRNGWVLVAPTIPYYRDYMDTAKLVEDDVRYAKSFDAMLDALPGKLGLKLHKQVLIYGFSRGAQLAHHYALFCPNRIESVAVISAGAYTLPREKSGNTANALALPYGIADVEQRMGHPMQWDNFRKISFWIGVGDKDNRAAEVARAFDPFEGKTRVERARAFAASLQAIGVDVQLAIFPNVDHEVTAEMRARALEFLRTDELADSLSD